MDSIITHNEILSTIEVIRDSFEGSVDVYTKGSCVKFAMILLKIFPKGRILYDLNHALFECDGMCYDINGYVVKGCNHIPIEEYGLLQMYKSMNLKYKI